MVKSEDHRIKKKKKKIMYYFHTQDHSMTEKNDTY